MTWIGALVGWMLGWFLTENFGRAGGVACLSAIAAALYMHQQARIARLEAALERSAQAAPPAANAGPVATEVPSDQTPAQVLAQVLAQAPSPARAPAIASGPAAPAPQADLQAPPAFARTALAADAPKDASDSFFGDDAIDTVPGVPPPSAAEPRPAAVAMADGPARRGAPRRWDDVDEHSAAVTSSIGASLLAWFQGGNTIVRLAVVILFVGVAFLVRYAAEYGLLPIELRLAAVAAGGLALTVIGWRLRHARRGYGLSLQGGGVGILYLTLFAALRLYALLPPGLAFALLAALAALTAVLALLQDALPLAVLGFAGGFLAPVLTSTGEGSHVMLFSYYGLLNLAIAWIAQRRAWKLLNLIGFVFTFTIGLAWGVRRWEPSLLASSEPFLVGHVLLYLWICVGYSRQLAALESPRLPYVDGSLVFGMPIVAFGLQAAMVRHLPYALALSAAVMSGLYLALGLWLWRTLGERLRLFTEGMLALGVIFLALVAPLALDARWTAAAWAVQGAGVAWIALRQQRIWALLMGLLLQAGAALSFWQRETRADDALPFANAFLLGTLLLGGAALFTARRLERQSRITAARPARDADVLQQLWTAPTLAMLHWAALIVGLLHVLSGGFVESAYLPWAVPDETQLRIALLAGTAVLIESLHRRLDWPQLAVPARPLLGLALLAALGEAFDHGAFSAHRGWAHYAPAGLIEVALLTLAGFWLLRRLDRDGAHDSPRGSLPVEHLLLYWTLALHLGLIAYCVFGHFVVRHAAWTAVAVFAPATALMLRQLRPTQLAAWPVGQHARAFVAGLAVPWLALLLLWVLMINAVADGSMAPLPYVPLLNPIDLGHALVLLFALRVAQAWHTTWGALPASTARTARWVGAAAAFWWLNALLVRTLHQWSGTPLWVDGALESGLVQTSLTILWTVTALAAMFIATRRAEPAQARAIWMAGAVLLGVVVAKLLLIDLSHTSTLQRIVSFMGVGVLMLVIGYVAPLPPAARAAGNGAPVDKAARA